MLVTLKPGADVDAVRRELVARGLWVGAPLVGTGIAAGAPRHFLIGDGSVPASAEDLARIEGVAGVASSASAHPRVDASGPVVLVRGIRIGAPISGAPPVLVAGPCSVESEDQITRLAAALAPHGVGFLRGGAWKPRSSPYAFQGHGEVALRWLRRAADAHGMGVVTEALGESDVPLVADYADLVQVGSRNMQNFALLKAVGKSGKPVLLKRAMSASIDDWLLAAEYLHAHGAAGVVLCERGIRGFDASTRNVLDLGAVALLAHVRRLPVLVDPSHGAGRRDLVLPLAHAAISAGAAGVMIETHDDPGHALSDGPQAVAPEALAGLLRTPRRGPEIAVVPAAAVAAGGAS